MYGTKRQKKNLGGIIKQLGRIANDLKIPLGLGTAVGGATSQMKPKNKKVTPVKNKVTISDAQKKGASPKEVRAAVRDLGRGKSAKPTKNIVTSKNGKAVRNNGKIVTFGGANKGGKKSREGR